jgi:hypothetical protein
MAGEYGQPNQLDLIGAGDGNRTHVRSLGSFYTAIVRRPLNLQLIDYTPLSDSRSSVLIFPIFQNWAKRFSLENIDFCRSEAIS